MATKTICDRCGYEIGEKMYASRKLCKGNARLSFPTEHYSGNEVIYDIQDRVFDLCPQCQADVLNYITGHRKVNE